MIVAVYETSLLAADVATTMIIVEITFLSLTRTHQNLSAALKKFFLFRIRQVETGNCWMMRNQALLLGESHVPATSVFLTRVFCRYEQSRTGHYPELQSVHV